MNILKLQDELKSVPDNALVGYVQNPTGHVPSYLALSELQRRKDMREKYQQAQPEKTTVAEDLEQQAQPQPQGIAAIQQPAAAPVVEPGVAGLPVPDQMFSGQVWQLVVLWRLMMEVMLLLVMLLLRQRICLMMRLLLQVYIR
jgi:hypothetical protein